MGGNVRIDDATLRARAQEIQKFYSESGMTLPESFQDKKTGAIFTYKKDANGELKCSYQYHNEKPNDLIMFNRTTVPTSAKGLGYLTEAQYEEFLENHPGHFYATEYMASDESIANKEFAEQNLLSPDKKTRKAAENVYKDTVQTELMASGTYDKKAAKKLSQYALKDAKSGIRAENRTVYMDKKEYETAKKQLEQEQKAAKNRIKLYQKAGRQAPPQDEEILLKSVSYIKDKDVRKYVEAHPDRFYKDGKFNSEMYHDWAETHLQGDNTLTTSERGQGAVATGLSKGDVVKGVKYAGFDAQKDHVLAINMAKSLVGMLAGPIVAYMTNHNIHDIKELKDIITITADSADPSKYTVFVDGVSIAEARSEVIANFRDVAVRNAVLSSALATILNNGLIDPAGARDRKAEGITAATISTQNIFRGKDVTDIQGEVTLEEATPIQQPPVVPAEEKEQYKAEINRQVANKTESVVFNIQAQPTGKTALYKGKQLPQWKAHLWGALYAAYDIPAEEQKSFRNAYRKKYFKGASFYNSKDQETLKDFEYQFKGETRKVSFDSDKYHNTWDYYVRDNDGSAKSAHVKEQGSEGTATYNGKASMSVNDEVRTSVSAANQSDAEETRQYLQKEVNKRVKNGEITPEQGQRLINEIQNTPVRNLN